MNIAEYIEQKMRSNGRKFTIFYHKFANEVGINDKQVAKEQIELYLQELHKCQVMTKQFDSIWQWHVIQEIHFTPYGAIVEFSRWVDHLRLNNPHWLSDILQKTRMNNYIVIRGN